MAAIRCFMLLRAATATPAPRRFSPIFRQMLYAMPRAYSRVHYRRHMLERLYSYARERSGYAQAMYAPCRCMLP